MGILKVLFSYLLINFWYTRIQANKAAMKAMIVNRIGDFGLAIGIFLIFMFFGTINFDEVFSLVSQYKDKNIDCEKDLVLIEDYLIKIMNTELNAKFENCQIIWITTEIFKSEYKIYGELLLRKNENRTNLIKNNFLNKIGKKLSKSFSTNIRLRSFSIKDELINAAQIKLGEDDDG